MVVGVSRGALDRGLKVSDYIRVVLPRVVERETAELRRDRLEGPDTGPFLIALAQKV